MCYCISKDGVGVKNNEENRVAVSDLNVTNVISNGGSIYGSFFCKFFPRPRPRSPPHLHKKQRKRRTDNSANRDEQDNTYRLVGNINMQTIVIQRDNIVLDGCGYLLQGNRSWLGGTAQYFSDTGNNGIIIAGRNNINVTNFRIEKYTTSIRLFDSSQINIVANAFADGAHAMDKALGIVIEDASFVLVERNNFTSTHGPAVAARGTAIIIRENTLNDVLDGIDGCINLEGSSNIISDNIVKASSHIKLNNANLNTIARNNLSGSGEGIFLFSQCANNQIIDNNLTGFNTALRIMVGGNNTFCGNSFVGNQFAVELSGWGTPSKAYNTFYGNTFASDSCKVRINDVDGTFWENGTVGNYWGNYNGSDSNGDGIGDTPYPITGYKWDNEVLGDVSFIGGQDNYPLMPSFSEQDTVVLSKVDSSIVPFAVASALAIALAFVGAALIVYRKKRQSGRQHNE